MRKQQEQDMLDRALAIGGGMDWITPIASLIGRIFGGYRTYKVKTSQYPDELMRLRKQGRTPINVNQTGEWTVFDL